jgi:Sulfotransferase domain
MTSVRRVPGLATRHHRVLPTFLVIGAQRAGTSTFFYHLCRHPQIARPVKKEVHFFDHRYWRGVDWYRSFFPTAVAQQRARRRGGELLGAEATPYYLFHPAVPARVAETLPDVLLIAILRNPVDRAYSHYQRTRDKNAEPLSFEKALAAEKRRLAGVEERLLADPHYRSFHHRYHAYVSRGLYADQLERWFQHFPRERFLVLRSEDFFTQPAEAYARALAFLGLDPLDPGNYAARNALSYDPLDARLRARLEERFAEPNQRLARLLDTDLWWVPGAGP